MFLGGFGPDPGGAGFGPDAVLLSLGGLVLAVEMPGIFTPATCPSSDAIAGASTAPRTNAFFFSRIPATLAVPLNAVINPIIAFRSL